MDGRDSHYIGRQNGDVTRQHTGGRRLGTTTTTLSSEEYVLRCKDVLKKRLLKCLVYLWATCWLGVIVFMGNVKKGLGKGKMRGIYPG
jgi:hypothetical protein